MTVIYLHNAHKKLMLCIQTADLIRLCLINSEVLSIIYMGIDLFYAKIKAFYNQGGSV